MVLLSISGANGPRQDRPKPNPAGPSRNGCYRAYTLRTNRMHKLHYYGRRHGHRSKDTPKTSWCHADMNQGPREPTRKDPEIKEKNG